MRPPAPDRAAGLTLRTARTFAVAVAASVVFAALAALVAGGYAEAIDERVSRAIRRLGTPALDAAMAVITDAGGAPFVAVVVLASAAFAAYRRAWRAAWVLVASWLAVAALSWLLKAVFTRARPALEPTIPLPESYSFPSGHAMTGLAVYGALAAVILHRAPRARAAVLAVTVLLVLAIGVSRVYLGVHWPSDVLAGFAAATPILVGTVRLLRAGGPAAAPRRSRVSR